MKRLFYDELLKWKNEKLNIKPLIVLGVRQCGKTYIIDEFCRNEYKNYKYVNLLEDKEIVNLYNNSNMNSLEKYNRLKILLNFDFEEEDSIVFFDEIQESEQLISELKYFCEQHNNVRIICAGSLLGIKLKRFNASFPVGKVKMLNMYPMSFEEFLYAMKQDLLVNLIYECFDKCKKLGKEVHEKALNLYRIYLITGGMPESINNMVNINLDYIKYDINIIKDIINSYFKDMNKYVSNETESLKINRVYNSLPSQLTNISKKFQYSNIHKDAREREYATAIDWLEVNNMVLRCKCINNPEIPLEGFVNEEVFKLYLSDVGILNNLLKIRVEDILNDNISLYKGVIAENYVATELLVNGYNLYYWKNNATAKIDFLIYNKDGIIPIEVKASNNTQSKSLKIYMQKYNPKYGIRISTKEFGYDNKNKIKSIPLYATFAIKNK